MFMKSKISPSVEISSFSIKVVLSPLPFICFNESRLKMMKNVFYFILKALLVLKIFKFLSELFAHVEKGLD